jgi:hypothetical protein
MPIALLEHTDPMFYIEWAWDKDHFYVTSLSGSLDRWSLKDIQRDILARCSEEPVIYPASKVVPFARNISGFLYHGSFFLGLHSDSKISDHVKEALKTQEREVKICEP